ncbi:MAG: hypothetical protein WC459_01860 [Patescibacteria group bacterium]
MPEGNKKLYMWISVAGTLFVIFLIWIASVRYSIKASVIDFSSKTDNGLKSMDEIEENIKKELLELKEALNSSVATSTNEAATSSLQMNQE